MVIRQSRMDLAYSDQNRAALGNRFCDCYGMFLVVQFGDGRNSLDEREVPFEDVLLTVLAIAGIGIAAFGVGVYSLLSNKIETNVQSRTDRTIWLAWVKEAIDIGWLHWQLYILSKGKPLPVRRSFLVYAINETKEAVIRVHSQLNENERDVEKLLLLARNNWAYYIYELDSSVEKVDQSNRLIALECIEYLKKRVYKFQTLLMRLQTQ